MHCINYTKREQENPLLFKLTLGHVSQYHKLNLSCHELLVMFVLSTLNSNWTNHKLRKKLANQKQRHMSLPLCGIRTRHCALIRECSIQRASATQASMFVEHIRGDMRCGGGHHVNVE